MAKYKVAYACSPRKPRKCYGNHGGKALSTHNNLSTAKKIARKRIKKGQNVDVYVGSEKIGWKGCRCL